jgi:hypothetical protein
MQTYVQFDSTDKYNYENDTHNLNASGNTYLSQWHVHLNILLWILTLQQYDKTLAWKLGKVLNCRMTHPNFYPTGASISFPERSWSHPSVHPWYFGPIILFFFTFPVSSFSTINVLQLELLTHYVSGSQVGNGAVHISEDWLLLSCNHIRISECIYGSIKKITSKARSSFIC